MGLGKTLQGIAIAKVYESEWPCLIVVPSALRLVWKQELLKWLPDLDEEDLCVVMKGNDRMHGRVTVISYDLLARQQSDFGASTRGSGSSPEWKRYGVLVVDESHYLKSDKAKRTKAVVPIARAVKVAVFLSGTPALSRPAELYNQISALRPRMFQNWNAYATRYCDAKQGRFGLEFGGASNLEELRALLRTVMIRRLKSEVLSQLPAKRRQQVHIELPSSRVKDIKKKLEQNAKLMSVLDDRAYPEAERRKAHQTSQQILNEVYGESGLAKLPETTEYINMLAEGGAKFLVFAHHKDVLDGICQSLRAQKVPVQHIRIDGNTAMAERERLASTNQMSALDAPKCCFLGYIYI
jgi:SWI/SNF-related matrix-associated actin-dependent regulator of chromatin subfamily A-like protein 1